VSNILINDHLVSVCVLMNLIIRQIKACDTKVDMVISAFRIWFILVKYICAEALFVFYWWKLWMFYIVHERGK